MLINVMSKTTQEANNLHNKNYIAKQVSIMAI